MRQYYGMVKCIDDNVGKLLETLRRHDLLENTIVVFTSDHGFNLGEHGCWQKLGLWEDSARVPLIIAPPETASAGASSNAVVELIDLYPTLADLAGLGDAAPSILQGQSLVPWLERPKLPDQNGWAYTMTRGGAAARSAR